MVFICYIIVLHAVFGPKKYWKTGRLVRNKTGTQMDLVVHGTLWYWVRSCYHFFCEIGTMSCICSCQYLLQELFGTLPIQSLSVAMPQRVVCIVLSV